VLELAMLVTLPKSAINTLFIPTIAELHASGEMSKLRRIVSISALWMVAGASVLGFLVWIASEPLLALYGPAFSGAGTCVGIMIVGNVLVAASGSQVYMLTMTGHERAAAFLAVLGTAVSLGLSALLIPRLGLNGSALASAGSLLIWNGAMACVIWKYLGQLPGVFAALCVPSAAAEKRVGPAPCSAEAGRIPIVIETPTRLPGSAIETS
jgi:O-antigen/teichoic acid export membrane protein